MPGITYFYKAVCKVLCVRHAHLKNNLSKGKLANPSAEQGKVRRDLLDHITPFQTQQKTVFL